VIVVVLTSLSNYGDVPYDADMSFAPDMER